MQKFALFFHVALAFAVISGCNTTKFSSGSKKRKALGTDSTQADAGKPNPDDPSLEPGSSGESPGAADGDPVPPSTEGAPGAATDPTPAASGASDTSPSPGTEANPTPVPPPVVPPKQCSVDVSRGAHLIIVIDNSTSMAVTDCPNKRLNGKYPSGRDLFECQDKTNREIAVGSIFARLNKIRASRPSDIEAASTMAIVNFTPAAIGSAEYITKLPPQEITSADSDKVLAAATFTRFPIGDTPYRNAVNAAKEMLDKIDSQFGKDGKKRIVLLVTDGEPTDRDPAEVKLLAEPLKGRADWITVMVTSGQSRAARVAAHRLILEDYERSYGRKNGGSWRAGHYVNFDAYMNDILALSGQIAGRTIEVAFADQLDSVIAEEVIHKEVECQ